jgi:hypothetical protein
MKLFIAIIRRIFGKTPPDRIQRKQMIEQLKRLQRRDRDERNSI